MIRSRPDRVRPSRTAWRRSWRPVSPWWRAPASSSSAGLTRAVAAGDGGGAVGRAAGDLLQRHLALVAVGQGRRWSTPKCSRLVMIENRVVSLPPCWVADEVKAAPTLPFSALARPQAAGLVEEVGHLRGHAAKARARADDDGVVVGQVLDRGDRGGLVQLVVRLPARPLAAPVSGTRLMSTVAPAARAPSATALAIVSMWP